MDVNLWAKPGGRIERLLTEGRLHRIVVGYGHPIAEWRINCDRCGAEVITGQPATKFCGDCRPAARREADAQRKRRSRARP